MLRFVGEKRFVCKAVSQARRWEIFCRFFRVVFVFHNELTELNMKILDINSLLVISFTNIFSHSAGCLCQHFVCLFVCFWLGEIFMLNKSPFDYSCFCFLFLRRQISTYIAQLIAESVLSVFFPRSFMIFGITCLSLIHFVFEFVYGMRKCSNFFFLHSCLVSPALLIEENVYFQTVYSCIPCHSLINHICVGLFLDTQFYVWINECAEPGHQGAHGRWWPANYLYFCRHKLCRWKAQNCIF